MTSLCSPKRAVRGFALIEIIVAIVLTGLLFTQVNVTFSAVLRAFTYYAGSVERLPLLQNMVNSAVLDIERGKKPEAIKKQINDPQTDLSLAIGAVKKETALGKFETLKRITVEADWPERQVRQPLWLVRFVYMPEEAG